MRILGIDPGYAILGWGVLDVEGNRFRVVAYDSILTDKDTPMPRRLQELHEGLKEIIEKYKPEEAAIEELYFNNNAKTAIMVGEARGTVLLACAKAGIKIAEYTLGDDDGFDLDDDFNAYADSVGEPDLSWYEDEDEEFDPESIMNEAAAAAEEKAE